MARALIAGGLLLPFALMAIPARAQTGLAQGPVVDTEGRPLADASGPIAPERVIKLFNGRDLSGWTTWLVDTRQEDPRSVYTVRDGMLRISGDGFGYLSTDRAYKDYRLIVELKWGTKTWRTRKGMARDSGLFLHSAGPDGAGYDRGWGASRRNTGSEISSGAYKAAIECQVMEGEFGGILLIGGRYADGRDVPVRADALVARDRDAKGDAPPRFDPSGKLETFRRGWIHWSGRDPLWRDVFGFRGRNDVESPAGEWSRIESVCRGDRITVLVNGKRVNEVQNVFPSSGKILLQCEGSEVFFRKIELHPLTGDSPFRVGRTGPPRTQDLPWPASSSGAIPPAPLGSSTTLPPP